ncbi:hypothetical protein GCM10010954_27020 [Halobacillus andaensis]|uniref:Uncharacterized protein n=1 Tax=Halobacillus andaensis TaxID=1176239 RepID=A0A917EWG7_HALAA|nr:hypothetical protein [Halobacillus andaensis]MBP2005713.1 hypothetical protein [Halobacillus andaensis]GGF26571.1 hypothetical protein GCM10010954_27020 [Halobacillus andaensis]
MKKANRTLKEKVVIVIVWFFSVGYAIGYLYDLPIFPVTSWLKAIYEPIYYGLFGGP